MMKRSIIGFMAACIIATGCNAAQKTDEFTTKSGKTVKITCIKHASLEITYDGVEIQIDPVGVGAKPETDYGQFPKANLILITHEHRDHFEREAIAQIRTPATTIYSNMAVYNMFRNCIALANGDSVAYRDDITLKVVPAYNYSEGRTQFHPKGRISSPSMACAYISLATLRISPRWQRLRISTLPSCLATSLTQ